MKKLTGNALDGALKDFQDKPVQAQNIKKRSGWLKHAAVAVATVAVLGLTACGDDNASKNDNTQGENAPITMQVEGQRNGTSPLITLYPDAQIVVEGVYRDGADREEIFHFDGSRVHQSTVDDEMTYENLRYADNQQRIAMLRHALENGTLPEGAPEDMPPVEQRDGNYRIEVLPNNQVVAEHFTINGVPGSRIWFFDNSDIVVNTFGDEAGISRISSTDARNYTDLKSKLDQSGATKDEVNITADNENQSVSKTLTLNGQELSLTYEFASNTRRSGQLTVEIDGNTNSVPISTARSGFARQMRNNLTQQNTGMDRTVRPGR